MLRVPAVGARGARSSTTRHVLLAAAMTLPVLLATPGPLLAKWAIFAEFEPAVATAGRPEEITAVLEIVGHEAGGVEAPSLTAVGPVFFHLRHAESGEVVIAMARKDGRRDGRYEARVTLPHAGEWRVDLLITLDGSQTSPYRSQHTITVGPPNQGAPPLGAALIAATAAAVLLAGYRALRRRTGQ
jgi:hypothetical protein